MCRILSYFLILRAAVLSTNAVAGNTTYETFEMNNYNAEFSFPNLNLDEAKATLQFESSEITGEIDLQKLVLNFPEATDITASGFSISPYENNIYRATVRNAWVFKEIVVEVTTGGQDVQIRLLVPEVTSTVNNNEVLHGPTLFSGNSVMFLSLIHISEPTRPY